MLTTALFFEANDCIMRVVFSPALTRAQISDLHSYMEDADTREEIKIVAAGAGVDWNRHTESTVMFLACEMNWVCHCLPCRRGLSFHAENLQEVCALVP